MITRDLYQKWQHLAGRRSEPEWSTRDDLYDLFHAFRPNGLGVVEVLSGLPGSDVVLPRLLELYHLTSLEAVHGQYLKVANPAPLCVESALLLLQTHIER